MIRNSEGNLCKKKLAFLLLIIAYLEFDDCASPFPPLCCVMFCGCDCDCCCCNGLRRSLLMFVLLFVIKLLLLMVVLNVSPLLVADLKKSIADDVVVVVFTVDTVKFVASSSLPVDPANRNPIIKNENSKELYISFLTFILFIATNRIWYTIINITKLFAIR